MLLKRLSEACGGPGREDEVRNIIRNEIDGLADEIFTDALGNLIAVKHGSNKEPKVMLTAHMDEVALMITNIEKNGLLKFSPVGSLDLRVLIGKSVIIGSNKITGVIGSKPIHLQEAQERNKPFNIKELYIDIGANTQEEAKKHVKIGTHAYFTTTFAEIGNQKYKGKAFDDRVGCALLIEALKERYSFTLYAVFTVQEEVGLRGSGVASYGIEPDISLVLEGTTASDVPDIEEHKHATTVGQGPCLTFMDRSVIPDPKFVAHLLKLAEKEDIPVQLRRNTAGGTDAGKIQATKTGVSVAVLAIPCRYIHSPASIMSQKDYVHAKLLIKSFLKSIEKGEINFYEKAN